MQTSLSPQYAPATGSMPTPSAALAGRVRARYTRATSFDSINTIIAWVFCGAVLLICTGISDQCRHWFMIPVFACGVLVTLDAVKWFRGQFDPFDPVGLLGIYGVHFFFIAPLLHVVWNWWLVTPDIRPEDLRPWLGAMACLNLVGLLIYRYLRDPLAGKVRTNRKVWVLQPNRFWMIVPFVLILSAFLQFLIYWGRGGILGYIVAFTQRSAAYQTESGQVGMVAECFPIVAMIAYAILAHRNKMLASWPALAATVLVMGILIFIFGGLRGSRSNTLFSLFWVVGMIHFVIRPINKKVLISGLAVVMVLGYAYTLVYKAGGLKSLSLFERGADFDYLERKTGRSTEGMLLGDLGRADMQAFLLRQSLNRDLDYDFGLGRTYYATLTRFIPSFIWRDRPLLKPFEGTEIQWGKGSYDPLNRSASYVYGMAGEAILNFGPYGVPLVFLVWTLVVARGRKWILALEPNDVRRLLSPLVSLICFMILSSDSDNIFFTTFKWGTVPVLLLWVCSAHIPIRQIAVRATGLVMQRAIPKATAQHA